MAELQQVWNNRTWQILERQRVQKKARSNNFFYFLFIYLFIFFFCNEQPDADFEPPTRFETHETV